MPPNITVVSLPAKCPELDPIENVWRLMRDNWVSNRAVRSYDSIADHCCHARYKLISQPWRVISFGTGRLGDG